MQPSFNGPSIGTIGIDIHLPTVVHIKGQNRARHLNTCISCHFLQSIIRASVIQHREAESIVFRYTDVDLPKIRRGMPKCGVTNARQPVKVLVDGISWILVREGGCTVMVILKLGGLKQCIVYKKGQTEAPFCWTHTVSTSKPTIKMHFTQTAFAAVLAVASSAAASPLAARQSTLQDFQVTSVSSYSPSGRPGSYPWAQITASVTDPNEINLGTSQSDGSNVTVPAGSQGLVCSSSSPKYANASTNPSLELQSAMVHQGRVTPRSYLAMRCHVQGLLGHERA